LGEALLGYVMVAPVLAIIATLSGYQLVRLVLVSLTDEAVGKPPGAIRFVGLANYGLLVSFPDFPRMVVNSACITSATVGLDLTVGMLAALALNAGIRGRSVLGAILFLPWVIPAVVAVFLWRAILNSDDGVLDAILVQHLHLIRAPIVFLATPVLAYLAIIFVLVWRGAPFAMLLFLGGLQSVPGDVSEAAKADGANAWQRWRYVTLPHVRRIVAIVAILLTIWTLEDYTTPYSLTLGGPGNTTSVLATLTYFFFFGRGTQTAIAAAVATLFLPVVAALILVLSRQLAQREVEV
jgi:multiple sugar transport system permease protein